MCPEKGVEASIFGALYLQDLLTNTRIPVRTQRHFNVHTTSSQPYGSCIDVETTMCAYSVYLLECFPWSRKLVDYLQYLSPGKQLLFIISSGCCSLLVILGGFRSLITCFSIPLHIMASPNFGHPYI